MRLASREISGKFEEVRTCDSRENGSWPDREMRSLCDQKSLRSQSKAFRAARRSRSAARGETARRLECGQLQPLPMVVMEASMQHARV